MFHALLSTLFLFISTWAYAVAPARLQLETDPRLDTIHPRESTLALRILIHHADGTPVSGARLRLQLKAPDTPWLASTDFPVIEGTRLLENDFHIQGAHHDLQFVPPIRGTYTLTATVEPLPGDTSFAPAHASWQTTISESPERKNNLVLFLSILISIGGISGFVIGRSPVRPAGIVLLLALSLSPREARAHGSHEAPQPMAPAANIRSGDGHHIEFEGPAVTPRVGELALIRAHYRNAQGQPIPAHFRLQILQLEHQRIVWQSEITAPDGILNWNGQFVDGSPHRVMLSAVPLGAGPEAKPAHAEADVNVMGVEPPLRSVIKSLGFLLAVTALSLMLGILLGRFFPVHKGKFT